MAYSLEFTFTNINSISDQLGYTVPDNNIQVVITVEGNQLSSILMPTTVGLGLPDTTTPNPIKIGYIFKSATPVISITITASRDPVNSLRINSNLVVSEFSNAYDPVSDCCVVKCPSNNGVNIFTNPPVCAACNMGLVYNSILRSCQCQTGFYKVVQSTAAGVSLGSTQCYPCFAQLCQDCNQATPNVCNSCIVGAGVNSANICTCLPGYYQNGSTCSRCPSQCLSCSVASVCTTCVDSTTRDTASNTCACLPGYYDSGSAICSKCSSLCLTCNSSTTCTSCFATNNRTLSNGQCVCMPGFYQIVNQDGSLTCGKCDPTCTQCSLLPTLCSNCDANSNRILGFDVNGNQVCNCVPGFSQNANGDCVQTNCNADPYCSTCQMVLSSSICIGCISSSNRILASSQKCVCKMGFYDLNGICTACSSGCASCSSSTSCTVCVASATTNNDGTCTCPGGYYFTTTSSSLRFCTQCPQSCLSCTNATTCQTCKPNYVLSNGVCSCPNGRFVNTTG